MLCVNRQGEARMQADETTEGSRAESDGGWDKRGGDGKEDSGSNLERASGTLCGVGVSEWWCQLLRWETLLEEHSWQRFGLEQVKFQLPRKHWWQC